MQMTDIEFKVNTAQLIEEANELTGHINDLRRLLDQYRSLIDSTTLYWSGDASDQFRELYLRNQETAMNMLLMLEENPKDLIRIAANYTATELRQEMTANALPSDVIV